jgi:hypothetical protein
MTPQEAIQKIRGAFPFDDNLEADTERYLTIINPVLRYLHPPARILDFGAGPADKTAMFAALGFSCAVYDDLQDDWHQWGNIREQILNFARQFQIDYAIADGRPWNWQKFRWDNTIPHPSGFTNRRYFDRVGNFNESLRIAMDYEFFLRGGKTLKANFVPFAVSGMREGGLSRKQFISTFLEGQKVRVEHQVLPSWLSWFNFFRQVGHYYVGGSVGKISLLRKIKGGTD